MADNEAGIEPEIDVDALDDAAFAELKGKMAEGIDSEGAGEPGKEPQATPTAKTAEAAPEATGEKAEDDDEDGPKSETVPHGQFHRERERRKQAEQRASELEERFNKLAARVTELSTVQAKPAEEEKPRSDEPDPSNPLEQIAWLVKEVREGRMSREEAQKQAREDGERHTFAQNIKAVEDAYKEQTPDYEQALQFAAKSRDDELALMYPQMTGDQRQQYILQEWGAITRNAMATGQNPAEMAYRFAQMRGYRRADPQPEPSPAPANPVAEIAQQEETRKAAMSLGKTGGGITNTGAITPEQLLDMSDDEFAQYKAKHGSVARAFAA